jgi:hypothetical protein
MVRERRNPLISRLKCTPNYREVYISDVMDELFVNGMSWAEETRERESPVAEKKRDQRKM